MRAGSSRRRFLRALGTGAAGLALPSALLGACSSVGQSPVPVPTGVAGKSGTERTVRFGNWPDYIDTSSANPPRHPTLREFTRQTGIRVDYSEPIVSNEQFVGQLGLDLAMGHDTGYDLVVLTDWMVAQMIALGWVQPLSMTRIPNARRLLPGLRGKPLPGVLAHALPWTASFTGIGWNARATGGRPVTSMSDLLTAPDLHGRVGLVADMRDVIGLILLEMGHDPARVTDSQFGAALQLVDRAFRGGQIKTVSDYYYLDLVAGRIAASVAYPGDITFYQPTTPQLHFILPKAGWMIYTDNMMIPAFAPHRENAERLMNFYYQPEIAAQLTVSQEYLCPVRGTQQVMRRLDPALADLRYVFPPESLIDQAHSFRLLSTAQNEDYTSRYAAAVGL